MPETLSGIFRKLHQIDTYYTIRKERPKLCEINGQESQLIPYFKEYSMGPMKSSCSILHVKEPKNTKEILNKLLGTITVFDKKREILFIRNIRIHLDKVKDIGTYIEFDAVYEENFSKTKKES